MEALRARIWGWLLPKSDRGTSRNSQENEPLEASISRHQPVAAGDLVGSSDRTVETTNSKPALLFWTRLHHVAQDGLLTHSNIYIGRTEKSSSGQQRRWSTVAPKSGGHGGRYFLGKRPYFPQVDSFVRSNWKGIQHVSVSSSGFFFFRFFRRLDMEDVIEGGPWLFQGQPIVLQPWEQGMSLRRQKHTQIPVWIRLRHLPMEYWTDEGLSTVASGVGTPLYTDGITKDCSRLDFARVCVMLDFNSALPKHLVVISPVLRNGKEDPKRIDVEYEWLPQRCKSAVLWDMYQLLVRRT
ncbi:UNVERIFIED_CONTAM: hypothetical protein Scaly_3097900 [Sesamum calycinum]|uniref:DUF4283 domain-containing protein n=1 Tax=Sesamum calycinum TaxID=2727403 RepID=A0AAW2JPT9_9LAMI